MYGFGPPQKRLGLLGRALTTGLFLWPSAACDDEKSSASNPAAQAESLPQIRPNLPKVPTIPPPKHPVKHEDGSYSVYGLRQELEKNLGKTVEVTAFVVDVYAVPACAKRGRCGQPQKPHAWLADESEGVEDDERLQLVGYLTSDREVRSALSRGRKERKAGSTEEGDGVPGNFVPGDRIAVKGIFSTSSSAGFSHSGGLIDYQSHRLLKAAP